jgi:precorrin-6B methylase 2
VRYLYPLSCAKAESLLGALEIASDALVIDLGCGNGGLLIDAVARGNCRGVGVEADAELLTLADAEARRRGTAKRLQLINQPVADYSAGSGAAGEAAAVQARNRAQSLYHAYWRHGRDALGFGLHVFRKPRGAVRLVTSV